MNRRGKFRMLVLATAVGGAALAVSAQTQTNSLQMTFVQISAGEFKQGSPASESGRFTNETLHAVKITHPFWAATFPCRRAE